MTGLNRQVRLRARPEGVPQAHHFEVTEEALGPLAEGRARLGVGGGQLLQTRGTGEAMRADAVGEVVESRHPGYAPGERVVGKFTTNTCSPCW